MSGVEYSLTVVNRSRNLGDICVYQSEPNTNDPNVFSLAWFSKTVAPTTETTFYWTVDYSFVWSEVGMVKPGVRFRSSQTWPANLSTSNQAVFDITAGAFTFKDQTAGPIAGNLYVLQSQNIPFERAAVGIGMSGAGTFVVPAQPNFDLIFSPHPKYWVAFGTFSPGEVLDITTISKNAEINYGINEYSKTAIFGENNQWHVENTFETNARFLTARTRRPDALWAEYPNS